MKNIVVITLFLFTSSFFGQDLSDKDIINKTIEFLKDKDKDVLTEKICLNPNSALAFCCNCILLQNQALTPIFDLKILMYSFIKNSP
jgi:hypothetical protein